MKNRFLKKEGIASRKQRKVALKRQKKAELREQKMHFEPEGDKDFDDIAWQVVNTKTDEIVSFQDLKQATDFFTNLPNKEDYKLESEIIPFF